MASIKSVLTNYFKQLHFNSMSPAVRSHWEENSIMTELNSHMKEWRNRMMETKKDKEDTENKNK